MLGYFYITCSYQILPKALVSSVNAATMCDVIEYDQSAITSSCIVRSGQYSNKEAVVQITNILTKHITHNSTFYPNSNDSSGSIYFQVGFIYLSFILLGLGLTVVNWNYTKSKKVHPNDTLSKTKPSMEEYLKTNFFSHIFSNVYSNLPFFERMISVLERDVSLLRFYYRFDTLRVFFIFKNYMIHIDKSIN